jgi:glycosyltransferase involved in cell wall biosynthesis
VNIGLLFEYTSLNGGERSMLAVLDRLIPQGLRVTAFAPPHGPLIELLNERRIAHIPMIWRTGEGSRRSPEVLGRELARRVDERSLDLLHANSLAMGRILGAAAPYVPCPTTAHLRDILRLSRAAVADLNRHMRLFAVSRATKAFHVAQGVDPDRIVTLYNGIDPDEFAPRTKTGSLHRELGLPAEALLAGTIGQICLRKGHNHLAQAAVLLRDRFPHLHYLVVGLRHSAQPETVQFDERITATFVAAGMADRLHRLGFRSDIPPILNELDLLVHPALQEPLGRVLLEAAGAGTPIVATNVGGTGEILEHNRSAWLVSPGSAESLAEGITRLLDDEPLRQRCSQTARETVRERFAITTTAQRQLEAWRLLNRRST